MQLRLLEENSSVRISDAPAYRKSPATTDKTIPLVLLLISSWNIIPAIPPSGASSANTNEETVLVKLEKSFFAKQIPIASPSAQVCINIDKNTCHIAEDVGLTPIANPEKKPSTPKEAARRNGLFPPCFCP